MINLSLPLRAAFSLVAIAALPGCGGAGPASAPTAATPATQAQALEDTLMAHHDRAMTQTEQLFELKAKLTAAKLPAATTTPVVAKMQAADQAMMNWMHHYQAPDSTAPAAQRLTYLQDQQRQLAGIERRLRGAIDSATATLHQPPAAGVVPAAAPATK